MDGGLRPQHEERAGHRVVDEIEIGRARPKLHRIGSGMRGAHIDPPVPALQLLPRETAQGDLCRLLGLEPLIHDPASLTYAPEFAKKLVLPEKGGRRV